MAMSGSGVERNALAASGAAQGQAGQAAGVVSPIYAAEATSPQGYTPQQKANLLTSSEQTLGGSTAGAVGQGGLFSARTNNAGGAAAAIDDAARNAGVKQSENALDVENKDAALTDMHRTQGLEGLSSIYRDANATGSDYLKTAEQARANNPWMKLLQAGVMAGGTAAAGAGY